MTPRYIEDNEDMIESYIMVEPSGRFYQNSMDGHYSYSLPITEVGAKSAFNQINFSLNKYDRRYFQ
jgi:radical S-adenosyl methionine domain-containing protein 2